MIDLLAALVVLKAFDVFWGLYMDLRDIRNGWPWQNQ